MQPTLLVALLFCAATTGAFEPIREVRVETKEGAPRLTINGKPRLPLMFFPNSDVGGPHSIPFQQSQTRLARNAGVHIISFPLRVSRKNGGMEQDYAHADACLARFVAENPEAVFLLRMYPGPWPFWGEFGEIPEDQLARYADGSRGKISIASGHFWQASNEDFAETIRYLEDGPYGDRILGYWAGGPQHEMFPDNYRTKGPDYSKANQDGFRAWLRAHYGNDDALRRAWGRNEVTLAVAQVPAAQEGRFPMHGLGAGETARIFYELPEEQPWLDYSRYVSDIASERILDWARLIKRETGRRKLTGFFYGYSFELCGSFNAHDQIQRVLESPDVDLLGSPISYMGRLGGESGGFMSLADSIAAHGKLWFNEDDMRTSIVDPNKIMSRVNLWQGQSSRSAAEDRGVLNRNLGAILVHRAGTWWMDLIGAGAFDSADLWSIMHARAPLFQEVYDNPKPYGPEVALVVDPPSRGLLFSDWDANFRNLVALRNECMRSGVSVGFYSLDDFVDGVVPPCKAYLFANVFALSGAKADAIRTRLNREQATAIWVYAPGCYGPEGFDATRAERVTGIALARDDGVQGSRGTGVLADLAWGWQHSVSPRTIVSDAEAASLGHYQDGGAVSAAMKRVGDHTSMVICDLNANQPVLTRLFEKAGAHVYTRGGEVIHSDGVFLIIHRAEEGDVTVALPAGKRVAAIDATVLKQADGAAVVRFAPFQTAWLRLIDYGHPAICRRIANTSR